MSSAKTPRKTPRDVKAELKRSLPVLAPEQMYLFVCTDESCGTYWLEPKKQAEETQKGYNTEYGRNHYCPNCGSEIDVELLEVAWYRRLRAGEDAGAGNKKGEGASTGTNPTA